MSCKHRTKGGNIEVSLFMKRCVIYRVLTPCRLCVLVFIHCCTPSEICLLRPSKLFSIGVVRGEAAVNQIVPGSGRCNDQYVGVAFSSHLFSPCQSFIWFSVFSTPNCPSLFALIGCPQFRCADWSDPVAHQDVSVG